MKGKKTPLSLLLAQRGAKMIEYAGYDLPLSFEGIRKEHKAVRERAGLFDISHMGQLMIEGEDSTRFLDWVLTNRIAERKPGVAIYSPMCNREGGTVDDLVVYPLSSEKYLLIVNAANRIKDQQWLTELSKTENQKVRISDLSDEYALLALQGPKAERIIMKLIPEALLEPLTFFHFNPYVELAETKVMLSRSGYCGEDGFEILVSKEKAQEVFLLLEEAGRDKGMLLCGLGARDTLRFEAGLTLYGNELSDTVSPVEASLNQFIDFDKPDFIGKKPLIEIKSNPEHFVLVGLEMRQKGVAREGYRVYNEKEEVIGCITTGYSLEGYDYAIASCRLNARYRSIGTTVYVEVRNRKLKAAVCSRNFRKKQYKR